MSNSEQIIARLSYLRNSLVDNDCIKIQPDVKSPSCLFEELKAGRISEKITLKLFQENEKNTVSVNEASDSTDKSKEKKEVKLLSVFIYPLKYKYDPRIEHGKSTGSNSDYIYPLCLPAVLSREGILSGELNSSPFIPRRYLSPQSRETSFFKVCSVSDQDEFFKQNSYEEVISTIREENGFRLIAWNECWDYAEELWEKLAGLGLRHLEIPNYILEQDSVLFCSELTQNFSRHLTQLYNNIRDKKSLAPFPLLEAFLSSSQEKEKKTLNLEPSVLVNEKLIAQMNKKRPKQKRVLSHSQNVVMDYFLDNMDYSFDNKKNPFLIVNGPPGTGKTALIQSLIANIWVQAALDMDKKEPPIIVATSANNNAVTNVIESFKPKDDKNNTTDPFYKRWLPDIHSFGTYCASAKKIEKKTELKQGWLATAADGNIISYMGTNDPIDVEDSKYLKRACTEFEKNFSEVFKKQPEDLAAMSKFLHEKLSQAVNDIQEGCAYQKPLCEPFDKSFAEKKSKSLEEDINLWSKRHKKFSGFKKKLPFYIRWNRFILIMRKIFGKAEKRYFKKFRIHERIVQQLEKSQEDLKSISNALKTRKKQEQQWQAWCSKQGIDCKVEELSKTLDTQPFRWRIFYLATHYWEARWLQDMEECTSKKGKGQPDLKALWLRRAKLSPCFVSTLHMLPRFFRQGSKASSYLYNFIDYLIFDESGQTHTHVAAPNLALAKRAIIIGDTKQIEPICNIPEAIDIGNCIEFKVIAKEAEEEEYKAFTRQGLAAAYNSLMDRAHYLCDFKQREDLDEAGFFLREHWRCVPEIASYFNELAYSGYLEPERPSLSLPLKDPTCSKEEDSHTIGKTKIEEESIPKFRLYPALGYAHILGQPEKKGTSRCNRLEAYAIIDWLKRNATDIRKCYNNKPLHEIVAIITPFKPQGSLLSSLLKEAIQKSEKENQRSELDKDITIGTVHALQGAERPLIIFSPAYGASESLYFIDKKVNLLNVAVSRAQDSFLVFGNMNLFDSASSNPSGLLARKLFADETNEIFDIEFFNINVRTYGRLEPLTVDFIDNLEGHQKVLRDSIQEAKKRVLITSPYISINAINADKLGTLINEARNRNIQIAIITDDYINKERETSTLEGRKKLKEAGATVNIHPNIHDKMLCVDDHTIVIGSFNWLSASRAPEYAKVERSIFCKGGTKVYKEIDKCWERLEESKKRKSGGNFVYKK